MQWYEPSNSLRTNAKVLIGFLILILLAVFFIYVYLYSTTTGYARPQLVSIIDAKCMAGYAYFVTVKNLDHLNNISIAVLSVRIDNITGTVNWDALVLSNNGTATGTIESPAGGATGTWHRIRVNGPSNADQMPVLC